MNLPRLMLPLALLLGPGCNNARAPGDGESPAAAPPEPAPTASSDAAPTPADAGTPADPDPAPAETEAPADSGSGSAEAPTASPDPSAGPAAPDGEPSPDPASTEPSHHTVLILGSSLARTAFGSMLQGNLDDHPQLDCHRFAKSATGLSRPDYFDWWATAKRELNKHQPDVIIVVMGGNDGQDLRAAKGNSRVRWGSDGWGEAYRERVDDFVALLAGEDRQVLWLGMPRTNTTKLERKLATIRALHRAGVEAHPRATYIDPTPLIEDQSGALRRQIKVRGKNQPVRGDDGVHFTMAGSRFLADGVTPLVLGALGIDAPD